MSLPYWKHYPKEWLTETSHLTDAECGIYMRLLSHMWGRSDDCSLPDDDNLIPRLLKMDKARWVRIKAKLTEGFGALLAIRDGKIIQKNLQEKYEIAQEISEKRSLAALQKNENLRTKGGANAEQMQSKSTHKLEAIAISQKPDIAIASYGQAGSINLNGNGYGNGATHLTDFHLTPQREADAVKLGFTWGRQELERELRELIQRKRNEGQPTISDTNWQRWIVQAVTYRNKHEAPHSTPSSTSTPTITCAYAACNMGAVRGGRYCSIHGSDDDYNLLQPYFAQRSQQATPGKSTSFQQVGEMLRSKTWATSTSTSTPPATDLETALIGPDDNDDDGDVPS